MKTYRSIALAAASLAVVLTPALAEDTIKIADIEPLSGPAANAGDDANKHMIFFVDRINAAGGVAGGKKLELLTYDGKLNVQDTLIAAEKAIDAGARLITGGNGTGITIALSDYMVKHNAREPDKAAILFDWTVMGAELTNVKCNYWYFRFIANTDMYLQALAKYLVTQPQYKKIYLLNQDYSFGHAIADTATKLIDTRLPGVKVVGTEFHPLGTVKDFSPYIAKIKASGADAVITGNWGNDLNLLVKAAAESGLKVAWFTLNGNNLGAPTAIGASGVDTLKLMNEWDDNASPPIAGTDELDAAFKAKYHYDFIFYRAKVMMDMLVDALNQVGAPDARRVAGVLSGMQAKTGTGEWVMRPEDHQISHPVYISTFRSGVRHDLEGTGFGFKEDAKIAAADTVTPVQCTVTPPN